MARRGERGIRHIRVNGRRVWQARVAWQGQRRSRLCESYEAARQAKVDLLAELQGEAAKAEAEGQQPATLRQLFAFYVADLEARGKGTDTVTRAKQVETAIERVTPALLDTQVSRSPRPRPVRLPPGPRPRGEGGQHNQPGLADPQGDAQGGHEVKRTPAGLATVGQPNVGGGLLRLAGQGGKGLLSASPPNNALRSRHKVTL
jgi:hypothetical protein